MDFLHILSLKKKKGTKKIFLLYIHKCQVNPKKVFFFQQDITKLYAYLIGLF